MLSRCRPHLQRSIWWYPGKRLLRLRAGKRSEQSAPTAAKPTEGSEPERSARQRRSRKLRPTALHNALNRRSSPAAQEVRVAASPAAAECSPALPRAGSRRDRSSRCSFQQRAGPGCPALRPCLPPLLAPPVACTALQTRLHPPALADISGLPPQSTTAVDTSSRWCIPRRTQRQSLAAARRVAGRQVQAATDGLFQLQRCGTGPLAAVPQR